MIPVIGLLGPAGSGKDVVADRLVERHGFVKLALADRMKLFVFEAFNTPQEYLWGPSEKRAERLYNFPEDGQSSTQPCFLDVHRAIKQLVDELLLFSPGARWAAFLTLCCLVEKWLENGSITVRQVLQELGTEWGRSIDDELWLKLAHEQIPRMIANGMGSTIPLNGIVIPDHRFLNEVKYTQARGGHVIRLRRLAKESAPAPDFAKHASETEQKSIPDNAFDLVLNLPEGISLVHDVVDATVENQFWATKQRHTRMRE